jgi:chromate reductase
MFGAVWAQAELRKVLAAAGARVVDGEVILGHAHQKMDERGALLDDEVRGRLTEVLADLCGAVDARQAAVAA